MSSSSARPGSRASRRPRSRANGWSPSGPASHTTVPCSATALSTASGSGRVTVTVAPPARTVSTTGVRTPASTG
jgi:hypothetical protein